MEKSSFDPADVLARWYQDYRKLIVSFIQNRIRGSEDVEDLTEETFQRAYRSLLGREELPEHPKKWLVKIAENECNRFFRDTDEYRMVLTNPGNASNAVKQYDLEDDAYNQPENVVERYELTEELQELLDELPEEQLRAVLLHFVEGFPFTHIATKYPSRAPSTVGKDAQRGIEQLRVRLTHIKH